MQSHADGQGTAGGPARAEGAPHEADSRDELRRLATALARAFGMAAGAVFFAFNVAPTEEIILIGFKMTEWHVVALAVFSLVLMHAFVCAVEFKGTATVPPGARFLVRIIGENAGRATAAQVVEGELRGDTGAVEKSETTIDYVPGRSRRSGGLFFTHDPRRLRLALRPVGCEEP